VAQLATLGIVRTHMDISKLSNADFAKLQRKLTEAGYLKAGFVSQGADWKFDFTGGREYVLLGVKRFLKDMGTDLSKKDLLLLAFMLDHTNEKGECSGTDDDHDA
jgi:hypothetical protein